MGPGQTNSIKSVFSNNTVFFLCEIHHHITQLKAESIFTISPRGGIFFHLGNHLKSHRGCLANQVIPDVICMVHKGYVWTQGEDLRRGRRRHTLAYIHSIPLAAKQITPQGQLTVFTS